MAQNSKKEVVIVIPVYRSDPKKEEIASLKQCFSILGHYDIVLLTYQGLICDAYDRVAKEFKIELKHVFFDESFFGSVEGYNRLCLDRMFYNRFIDYEYMLIYQLDAWVFRDELSHWCSKGYDFIGAPWFKKVKDQFSYDFSEFIGNGGLSLRRISFCLRALNYKRPIFSWKWLLNKSGSCNLLKFLPKSVGVHNNRNWFVMKEDKPAINEDLFFSFFKYSYMNCHFPNLEEALKFSFEVHPSYMFELNHKVLPFGCHAYRKYEYDTFWKQYIKDDM